MTTQPNDQDQRKQRLLEAMNLQTIERNPLTAEDKAMFAMFEREGWTDEQCRTYIIEEAKLRARIMVAAE